MASSLVFSIFVWIAVGLLTANFAKQRGRDPYLWFFLGVVLGILALIALFLLPNLKNIDVSAPVIPPENTKIVEEIPPEPTQLFHLKEWHCIDASKTQLGPLSFEALKDLWTQGKITSTSYVWTEGMKEWLPLSQVPNLQESLEDIANLPF